MEATNENTLVAGEDTVRHIAEVLDAQSFLKKGFTIMALYELEQAIMLLPAATEAQARLRTSTYSSFDYIVKGIYGTEDYVQEYISDTNAFLGLMRAHTMH